MTHKLPECPIAIASVLVGDKWKIQIMREQMLHPEQPKRFSELKKNIPHISDKMLSKSLKDLTEDHIILREVTETAPPRSCYRISELESKIANVLLAMSEWGQLYKDTYENTET